MRFIDLFAGLGGFHVALNRLGHNCVFASEKKKALADLYLENFGISVNRDISLIDLDDIPEHDILCAGFPCQPFSKAGSQEGLEDENNGDFFDVIVEIIRKHQPQYFILENVRNLINHNRGETWEYLKNKLKDELGYKIDKNVLSPHEYGIPQHRERFFIVGSKSSISHFEWPEKYKFEANLYEYLKSKNTTVYQIEEEKAKVLDLWQEFIDAIPKKDKLPSWPIWAMEFGATYPFENSTPFSSSSNLLGRKKGAFGIPLRGLSREHKIQNLPTYAQVKQNAFPTWKKHFIRSNRAFYLKYKEQLDTIVKKIQLLNISSWQKFEWNVQGGNRNLNNYIIQFRGSGVRVKRANYFPSLVTVRTQIPIIGWERRYITPEEGASIQSLGDIKLPKHIATCFGALGNAVNAELVYLIAKNLIQQNSATTISKKNLVEFT